jgi:acetyl esterase/lipase
MAAKLRAAGVPVTLTIVPRTRHIAMVNGFLSPRFSPALADTLAWIEGGEARGGRRRPAAAQKRRAATATPSQ